MRTRFVPVLTAGVLAAVLVVEAIGEPSPVAGLNCRIVSGEVQAEQGELRVKGALRFWWLARRKRPFIGCRPS